MNNTYESYLTPIILTDYTRHNLSMWFQNGIAFQRKEKFEIELSCRLHKMYKSIKLLQPIACAHLTRSLLTNQFYHTIGFEPTNHSGQSCFSTTRKCMFHSQYWKLQRRRYINNLIAGTRLEPTNSTQVSCFA